MKMSIRKDLYNLEDKSAVSALVDELCIMTECVHDQALTELINCDFDLQFAANKILESSNNKQIDNEWQLINRQKRLKKKPEKLYSDINEDGFKNRVHRNRKDRTLNKKTTDMRSKNHNNINRNVEHQITSDHENESRWDNVADIHGPVKELPRNDGFFSDDDFGQVLQYDDNSFSGPSTHLVSHVHQNYKTKINTTINATVSRTNSQNIIEDHKDTASLESHILDDCLTHQLAIFGKYSQTEAPKTLSIIPDKPISFIRLIKSKKLGIIRQYNFGINITESLTLTSDTETKYMSPKTKNVPITNVSDELSNAQNINQMFPLKLSEGRVSKDISGILNTIIHQQKVVAMALRNHHSTGYISYSKPISIIPMSSSDHFDPIYSMNIQTTGLHPNIKDCINMQSQNEFVNQSTFLASNNISVPFHANFK